MNNTKVTPNKISGQKQGIRIIKVAAFCFAIVSWVATAAGLKSYVFREYWQALMISFAIQSILFVFNLKLPFYFSRIRKMGFSGWIMKGLIIIFYFSLLFTSSWFSFVYIANTIYHKTAYVDANIELDSNYRKFLHQTNQYIDEYVTYLEENGISRNLSELQTQLEALEPAAETSLEDLNYSLEVAKLDQETKEGDLENLTQMQETAKNIYLEPLTERWRGKTQREQEKQDYIACMNAVDSKKDEIAQAKQNILDIEKSINDFTGSHNTLIRDFMMELAKDEPDIEVLDEKVLKLHELVIEKEEIPQASEDYNKIIKDSQVLTEIVNKYITMRKIQRNEIAQYLQALTVNPAVVPDPDSEESASQIELWNQYWKNNYSNLAKSIKAIPALQKEAGDTTEPGAILTEYNAQLITDQMDILQRNYLAGINQMERAKNLLFTRFNFLAVVSIIFALFLDVASLLAGLFIYMINIKRNETGRKNLQLDASYET